MTENSDPQPDDPQPDDPQPDDHKHSDYRAFAAIVAVFAAGFYVAIIVLAFGMISLFTNTDVIDDPHVGPVVGPVMTGAATLVTFVFLISIGTALRPEKQRIAPLAALGIGFVAYLVFMGAGGILTAFAEDRPFHVVTFVVGMLGSPFAIAVGVLAFVVTILYELVLVGRFQEKGRPRWPWERDEDE